MSDYNKLREALITIQKECASHKGSCFACPLSLDTYLCGITRERMVGVYDYTKKPMYWNLPDIRLMSENKEKKL